MAKKTTKKKLTTKRASGSKKITSSKGTAKKVTKKTTKKASTKKATSKKTTKKSTAKKTTKKAAPKKPPTKKKAAKKPAAKKPASKKTGTKKATTAKAGGTKTTKKSTTKSSARTTKKKSSRRSSGSDGAKTEAAQNDAPRYRSAFGGGRADTSAAAALVESAGLKSVREEAALKPASEEYTRLKKSPFTKKQLASFRQELMLKRAQIIGDVTNFESEALGGQGSGSLSNMPQHMADAGSDTYDQSLNLDLATSQRKFLKEIEDAIARIDSGTYGVCELLGKAISEERLENAPWARYSIEGAREMERRGYR